MKTLNGPIRRALGLALFTAAALLPGGCSLWCSQPPLRVVQGVDLERYAGTWYDVAHLPAWFQRDCVRSQAIYKVAGPGRIAVRNECETVGGGRKAATGTAWVVDPTTNARLKVRFHNWFSRLFPWLTTGDYWIVYLEPDYSTAMVGTPDRKYLWILSRTPEIGEAKYQMLLERARELGFEVDDIQRRPQD